ncbi:hypothetical protein E3N88_19773 [Mikania micrantha]|uniref:FBD domain-containing protein n=1 Tax=Mikania micrantha TaxID=192012 RepID=A0A5N6NS97_9ASTR|nr:hypothetical protein E3N88_19773 [Mikania micrantha]
MPRIIPVASWIDEAICRNIRELDIELDNIDFPDCFFTCGTLVKLKLRFVRFVTDELDQILIDLPNLISFDTSSQQTVAPSLPFVAPTVMVIKVNSLEFVKTTVYGLEIVFHVLENSSSLSKAITENNNKVEILCSVTEYGGDAHYARGDCNAQCWVQHRFCWTKSSCREMFGQVLGKRTVGAWGNRLHNIAPFPGS